MQIIKQRKNATHFNIADLKECLFTLTNWNKNINFLNSISYSI